MTRPQNLVTALPGCVVGRGGHVTLTPAGWLAWHPTPNQPPAPLPAEWIFRGLQDTDLDQDMSLLAVLNEHGMVWDRFDGFRDDTHTPAQLAPHRPTLPDDPAATVHISDAHGYLTALRDLAAQWMSHREHGTELTPWFHRARRYGLRPFPVDCLLDSDPPVVDLYQAGCLQLLTAMVDHAPLRRCRNETCRRPFWRKTSNTQYGQHWVTGVLYCSEQCKNAQNQRAYRRRRTEGDAK